ncbi:unnamed protein product [Rhodiola kirilowii]
MAIRFSARKFSTSGLNPLRVCVVGSGPSGFYTAEKLLKAHAGAEVDIIDRLPTPFGLVRSGVAPDHQETKIVVNQFSRVAINERCSFFGNLCLGTSISLHELREMYHVVVLSFGAESDRILGIPGEDLQGVYAAREFVWWYNGHPDCRKLAPDLKNTDSAVILGQGNVALDIARILLRPTSELSTTDIASHALEALEESSIRGWHTHVCNWNIPAGIKNLHVNIQKDDLCVTPTDEVEMKNSRIHRRIFELLSKAAQSGTSSHAPGQRELHFVFFRKPDSFLDSDDKKGHVTSLKFEKTMLNQSDADGPGRQVAVGTGEYDHINTGMVLKSIGYKSVPVDGLPFDHRKGIVPNVKGRVLGNNQDGSQHPQPGLYVCGWLKRGPTGIIGTNLYCAEETVASISEDLEQGSLSSSLKLPKPGSEGLSQLLDSRNVRIVPFSGWEKIDAEERRLGSLKNKPREKLASWEEAYEKEGCRVGVRTFRVIFNLCREAKLADVGWLVLWEMVDLSVGHCDACCGAERLEDACGLLKVMKQRGCGCLPNVAAYFQLLDKICKSRSLERALKLSDTTENEDGYCYCKQNVVTYTRAFCERSQAVEALMILDRMPYDEINVFGGPRP